MNDTLEFLARHGYWILVGVVLGRQACLPIPTNLFLLAAGALGRSGRLNPVDALGISVVTFLLADLGWYEAGRRLGDRLLHLLCGLSRDPDSCADHATGIFAKHGIHTLLVSKFVLGLDAVAAPLSGTTGVNPMKFLLFDAVGAMFWSSTYLILGYIFSNELERVAVHIVRMGAIMTLAAMAGFGYLMMNKLARWLRFLHQFTVGKITPEELRHKLDAGEDVMIVDLQGSSREPAHQPMAIPGAIRINPRRLEQYRSVEIPTAREIVLYCDCPGDFTAARVALALRRRGIDRVRPLTGGLQAWRDRGFPVTSEVRSLLRD